MYNRMRVKYERIRDILAYRGIISYLSTRKRIIEAILGAFLCLTLCVSSGYGGEWVILEKGESAPVTGVLINEQYLQKITKEMQEKEKLEIEKKVLTLQLQELTLQYQNRCKEIERGYWKTTGGFIFGLVVSLGTVFVLNKYVLEEGKNAKNNNNIYRSSNFFFGASFNY